MRIAEYKLVNGKMALVYSDVQEEVVDIPVEEQIRLLKEEISQYDYIGVKIAMGVATKEEYAKEIAYTETLREKIRKLEEKEQNK